ncbi:MAG: helix-turn-helix domain-containing protein [Alphaproteobacteria bacterium]
MDMPQTSSGSCGPDRGLAAPAATRFAVVCGSAAERHHLHARYNSRFALAEFTPPPGAPYRSRMVGLDSGAVRVVDMRERGGLDGRIAWREGAPGAWFSWGAQGGRGGSADTMPHRIVAGPGSEFAVAQTGRVRTLRVSLRGDALAALDGHPAAPLERGRRDRSGLWRPRVDTAKAWRPQQRILGSARFAEAAIDRGVDVAAAVEVAAAEVLADLVAVMADAADPPAAGDLGGVFGRRLVEQALALIETRDDEPTSVADVCRQLRLGERTLQRAFREHPGVGPRAYERRRRLRLVHGGLLAEGDRRSITDLAMHFGFWHLGRFAGAYAAMYGCSPSQTRRQAWGVGASPSAVHAPCAGVGSDG